MVVNTTDETEEAVLDAEVISTVVKPLPILSSEDRTDDKEMVESVPWFAVETVSGAEEVLVALCTVVVVNETSLGCSGVEDNCLANEDDNKMELSDWSNSIVLVTVYDDVFMAKFPWLLTLTTVAVGEKTPRSASDASPLPSVNEVPLSSAVFV